VKIRSGNREFLAFRTTSGESSPQFFVQINRAADARKGRENRPQLRCGNESQPHILILAIGSKANLRLRR
jgi:hypothetical protein